MVTPRPVALGDLPPPRVDRSEQRALRHAEQERVSDVAEHGLPYEVRAVGEAFRRYGALSRRRDSQAPQWALQQLLRAVRIARGKYGDEPLLALRAVQVDLFVRAVRRYAANGELTTELAELGGDFTERAQHNGWIAQNQIRFSQDELETLYRLRWAKVTDLASVEAFHPTVNEWRAYYRALLRHPDLPPSASREQLAQYRLKLVAALAQYDPRYPNQLANGILLYQAQRYGDAVTAVRSFLATHKQGRWRLRAQNVLATLVQYM